MSEPMIHIGTDVKSGRRVEVPLSVLARHVWVQGMTGGGKSIIVKYLTAQLIEKDPTASIVVVDLGADQFLYNGLAEAASPGRVVKLMSSVADHAWHSLDIFEQFAPLTLEKIPLVTGFLQTTLELDYGLGFGESYFSRMNAAFIRMHLNDFVASGVLHPTLEQFATSAASTRGQKLRDTSEVEFIAHSLMNYGQLLPSDDPAANINVNESLERGDLVYGFLGAMTDPGAKVLASILAWSFIYGAMQRYLRGEEPKRLYLLIDEFPLLAGSKQFGELLTLARKFGITVILVTQTSQQLRQKDQDLFPILWDNTAAKLWLTPTDRLDCLNLQQLSKDIVQQLGTSTTSVSHFQSSTSFGEVYQARLLRNEILDCAFSAMEGFAVINDFQGHREPIRFRFSPNWSVEEYRRLANTPLPKRPSHPVLARDTSVETGAPLRDAEFDLRQASLVALLERKQSDVNWKTIP